MEECDECTVLEAHCAKLGKVASWARQGIAYIVDDMAVVADAVSNPDGYKGWEPKFPIAMHGSLVGLCKKVHWVWDETMELRKALTRTIVTHEKESGHVVKAN